jgi:predicted phage baseplate assembly protein
MIEIPDLDDTTYEERVEAARKRLPAYDDGWTDHNPSDPGITLLELFAHLADTYSYQLDTVTDEHRRKYLGLLGERPQPPEPATARLSLAPPAGTDGVTVPAGTALTVVDDSDAVRRFETDDDTVLTAATLDRVVTEHRDGRTDHTQANSSDGMYYRAFGAEAEPPNALYLGFDGDPFAASDSLALRVTFHDDDLPAVAEHGHEQPGFYPSVNIEWEYCTDYANPRRADAWRSLPVGRDGTYAFYRSGRVTLAEPAGWTPAEWSADEHGVVGQEPGLYWLRCRVRTGGYEIPPQFDSIRLNVVAVSHRATVETEHLERVNPDDPSALTAQRYEFEHTPVLDATVTVDGETWTAVEDFDASGPTDRHYVLDREGGTVQFGDGVTGRLPPPDATVVATEYQFGGGRVGNVPAGANWRFVHPETDLDEDCELGAVTVAAASAGRGGTDGESLDGAVRRAKRDLQTPYRAVTESDYEHVVSHTPGVRIGRATVLVEDRPELGYDETPVGVTAVVVPYAPAETSRPEPSEGVLDAVGRHVDTYRLLTDRVTVEGPRYVDLSISVSVQTSGWVPESRVQRAVTSALESYLHPIHGFEGEGWPFGRTLYSDELDRLLDGVEFVDHVRDLSVTARGPARVDGDGNVMIDEATLFAVDTVETEIRAVNTDRDGV